MTKVKKTNQSWWATLPGILAALAAIITALAALVTASRHFESAETKPAATVIGSTRSGEPATTNTSATIRFWIRALPHVPGANAAKLFNNALGSWQAIIPTAIVQSDTEASANVLVDVAPDTIAVAEIGPPKLNHKTPLKILFGSTQKWTPQTFEAASCRMLGHILGLGYTQVPSQLMTENVDLANLPLTPQSDDQKQVRQKWQQSKR